MNLEAKPRWQIGPFILGLFLLFCVAASLFIAFMGGISTGGGPQAFFSVSVISICFFISALGIFKLKKWGRLLTFIVSSATLFLFGYLALTDRSKDYEDYVFYIGIITIFLGILYYLLRPRVKEQFK